MPSRIHGSLFEDEVEAEVEDGLELISSRRRWMALGSVSSSASSARTNERIVVSPAWAAASGPPRQSSYSGPRCTWQSMAPGKTILPVASMVRSAGGRSSTGAQRHDAPVANAHRGVEDLDGRDDASAGDDEVDAARAIIDVFLTGSVIWP